MPTPRAKAEPKRTKPRKATRAPSTAASTRPPHPFVRTGADAGGVLTDLGCPDCRGVLTVNDTGDSGFRLFRCRVGHAFSLESLVPLKEDELETALWTAIEVCEELASLHDEKGKVAAASNDTALARSHARRVALVRRHSGQLRALVLQTGTPSGSPSRRRR